MTPGENNLINPQCDILKDNWSVFSKKKNQLIFFNQCHNNNIKQNKTKHQGDYRRSEETEETFQI